MSTMLVAEILVYLGAIGVLQFGCLAFSARQLQGVTTTRLRQRMSSPLVRHAAPLTVLSAAMLLAGLTLRL
jgi:hypothetical protein